MSNFLDDNLNQNVFYDINFLEILGDNTFEYCLYHLLENDDLLSDFYLRYKNKHVGRKAYPPALLLRVIFYAYYRGITSSRVIERSCKTDFKFIALASGRQPHFTTIADFVSSNCQAVNTLFHKVLLICDKSGLIGKEHFAIDGCKLPTDASKQWSGTHAELAKKSDKMKLAATKIIDQHIANDSNKNKPLTKEKQQSVETLLANAKKIDAFLADNKPKMGKGKRPKEVKSNITDNESAKMSTSKGTIQGMAFVTAADEKHQIIIGAKGYGMGQEQATLKPTIDIIRQHLGKDIFNSPVVLTADTGFSSEENMKYLFNEQINAVVPDGQFRMRNPIFSESELYQKHKTQRKKTRKDKAKNQSGLPSTDFTVNLDSKTCICPTGKELVFLGDDFPGTRGSYSRFRGELSDCRNCEQQTVCMKNPVKEKGRQVSFLNNEQKQISYLDLMKEKIDSESGRSIYGRRMWTIEPVFGNVTSNKGLNHLSLRGEEKCTAQWLLYCMVHNIEKLWKNSQVSDWVMA
jgi:transposase